MSKNYVAELLKQLEDLRKKKALKEKKLMKLKALKSSKQEKSSGNSVPILNRKTLDTLDSSTETNPGLEDDSDNSYNNISEDFSQNKHSLQNTSAHPFSTKYSKSYLSEKGKDKENEIYKKPDLLLFEDHKLKNNIIPSNEVEKEFRKVNENNISTENIYSPLFADKNSEQKIVNLKTSPTTELLTTKDTRFFLAKTGENAEQKLANIATVISTEPDIENAEFLSTKNKEDLEQEFIKDNKISASKPVIKVNCASDTCVSEERNLSNDSSKSLILPNSRSKSPDLLDDSFDCNMSILIPSEQDLKNDEDDTFTDGNEIKVINSNVSEHVNNSKTAKEIKNNAKSISSQLEISPPCSVNPSLPESQIKNGIFNFPKFSTPSNMNVSQCDTNKNKFDHLQETHETQTPPCNVSDEDYKFLKNDDLHMIENFNEETSHSTHQMETNNFSSSQFNCILRSGLSSVLDSHYGSPKKDVDGKTYSDLSCGSKHKFSVDVTGDFALKKRKLNNNVESVDNLKYQDISSAHALAENNAPDLNPESITQSENILHNSSNLNECEKQNVNEEVDFDNTFTFMTHSNPFTDSQNNSLELQSCNKISPQVTETIDGLIMKVCENVSNVKNSCNFEKVIETHSSFNPNNEVNVSDSEILVIPETEGLGLYFSKDTEDFLETSTLSESCNHFQEPDNLLNTSSQSRLRTPVVNKIVSALRNSEVDTTHKVKFNIQEENKVEIVNNKKKTIDSTSATSACISNDNLDFDTSFLEDDTQELGNLKQIPYMSEEKFQVNVGTNLCKVKSESNLSFACSLYGKDTEPVIDTEIILLGDVKYAFLQQKTQIHVWRREKNGKWIKIFCHQVEEMLSLDKMCISKDGDNLVVVMLLSNKQQCCLQFLLFERDARVIKLMENTYCLEERHSMDSVLLCGLDELMFATAQQKDSYEVSLHAFIGLKENPRLMTAVLGSTDTILNSLCKVDKLPNALLGLSDSMLYIWHVLEARLVTAVSLHPHDYLPIKKCFWATVENGLIYFLTTCEGTKDFQVCQLLAANLATGFCQSAMTYSTQPSTCKSKILNITKATYLEPYLIVAYSKGAFLWSVTEEYCCAALTTKSETTTVAISKDTENWGLVAVGYGAGSINCYNLN